MEDYEHRLESHVKGLGWPDDRVKQFTRFVTHHATGCAQFALDVLTYAEEVHNEIDISMRDEGVVVQLKLVREDGGQAGA